MKTPSISSSLLFVFLFTILCSITPSHSHNSPSSFLQCLNNWGLSGLVYTPSNSSFVPILKANLDNRRFVTPSTPKPIMIVTPEHERHIRAVVLCSRLHGVQIRTRSGGHDFEGISSRSLKVDPFVILDLFKMSTITIDVDQRTAWVQGGATLGQVYYEISKVSNTLAFPGGFCPTVGVGGHFSGGGFGLLFRQYGLAADNVIDARLVNYNGNILDRDYMGEDVFWAIRGGGGGSFGVVTAWKINLVVVPQVLTTFAIDRTLAQNATELVRKWQTVAQYFPKEIYFAVQMRSVNKSGAPGGKTIKAQFTCIFTGRLNALLNIFKERFPELNVSKGDCQELSWVQSLLVFNGFPADDDPKVLADRNHTAERFAYKRKADYIVKPITKSDLEGIWNYLHEAQSADVLFIANGGIMTEIPESALPFPHRAGHLYEILYTVNWHEGEPEKADRYINWIRKVYNYVTPYASKSPRSAYVNYRDLDLGVNGDGKVPTWGTQYFKGNFKRLRIVKTAVDPTNFFRHEQSIPTLYNVNGGRAKGYSHEVLKAIS